MPGWRNLVTTFSAELKSAGGKRAVRVAGNAYAWSNFSKAYGSFEPHGFKRLEWGLPVRLDIPSPAFMVAELAQGKSKKHEAPVAAKEERTQAVVSKHGKDIKGIVRLLGRDLKGEMKLRRALARVKGVGERLAVVLSRVVCDSMGLQPAVMIGELSEQQLERLEDIISKPASYGVPAFMLNRRKDLETGLDLHLSGTDLAFAVKQDIERDKTINTWRGFRHQYGQKVRGQRTRSTGRTGMTVGVLRKTVLAKAGAAAQAQQAEKEKEKK